MPRTPSTSPSHAPNDAPFGSAFAGMTARKTAQPGASASVWARATARPADGVGSGKQVLELTEDLLRAAQASEGATVASASGADGVSLFQLKQILLHSGVTIHPQHGLLRASRAGLSVCVPELLLARALRRAPPNPPAGSAAGHACQTTGLRGRRSSGVRRRIRHGAHRTDSNSAPPLFDPRSRTQTHTASSRALSRLESGPIAHVAQASEPSS
jgi:hypothetical protein